MRKETEKEKEKGINYDTDSPFPLTEKMARENMGKNYKPSKKTVKKKSAK